MDGERERVKKTPFAHQSDKPLCRLGYLGYLRIHLKCGGIWHRWKRREAPLWALEARGPSE